LNELITQLIEMINREVESFERMLDLLLSEQDSIVRNDVETLQENLHEQEVLVSDIRSLEQERVKLTKAISHQIGMKPGELTLRKLACRLKGIEATKLQDVGDSLLQLQRKIQTTNRNNQILIEQSLRCIDQTLDIFTGGKGSPELYVKTGKKAQAPSGRTLLNRKA